MLHMYAAPRHTEITSPVGTLRVPTHKLIQGCPAATLRMAISTFPCIQEIRALASTPTVRWVDDMTAYVEGAEAAEELAREGALLALASGARGQPQNQVRGDLT